MSGMQGTRGGRGQAGDGLRINGSRFHLTYAACYPDELDKQYLKARAEEWARPHGGLQEWSVGREDHTEPADPERDEHFHLYMKFGKPKDIGNRLTSTVFDVVSAQSNLRHPEIQGVGSTAQTPHRAAEAVGPVAAAGRVAAVFGSLRRRASRSLARALSRRSSTASAAASTEEP